jgi:hypothetical protein
MYLHADKYVSNYSFEDKAYDNPYNAVIDAIGARDIVDSDHPSATISVTVAYWRKANAIHKWFVDNVQGGEDDCGEYPVSRYQLRELQALCKEIIDDPSKAMEVLPPASGFFFGGTDLDDWYYEQSQYTYDRITDLLEKTGEVDEYQGWSFTYLSSW